MAAMTWMLLQNAVAAALVQATSPYTALPADFVTLFPQATSYAEGRIYRDIVLLTTRTQDTSLTTVAGIRTLALAGMTVQTTVLEGVALLAAGQYWQYDMASLDVVDHFWPQQSLVLAPNAADWVGRYAALLNDQTLVIAPTPDAAYTVQITGLFPPAPISATNPTTYLASNYAELLIAACMVWLSGALLRNYGAQSDESPQAMSWEKNYAALLGPAKAEERRRRGLTPDEPKG